MKLDDLEIIPQSQKIYNGFNDFMLSSDVKVFGKMLARTLLFNKVKNIPGDIVEFGVFKGTGLMTFLKLKRYLCPNTVKKVVGFDFFETDGLLKPYEFDLIKGDASQMAQEYVKSRPGLKISLLYLDLDLAKPTYDVLCAMWNKVSQGGVVVFDEYAYQKWSESQGVDQFFEDKDVEIISLNYMAPTACVVKK